MEGPSSQRRLRAVAAGLLGLGVVGAGALVGERLAVPPSAVTVLDTAAVALAPTPSTTAVPSPPASTDTTVTATRGLMRGDCVDDRSGSEVRVACEVPHTRELVAVLDASGLERELGSTARPTPGSSEQAALDAYCRAQLATYLPRPLAPGGRFRSVQWLIVPEAWARGPGVECALEEYEVTVDRGFARVTRTGRLQTDLPVDQGLMVPAGACLDVTTDRFEYVACPGGNARALGSIDWPASSDSQAARAACVALQPTGPTVDQVRLRVGRPSDADLAAGARRAVCFLLGT